jgi:hypothetical protein
VYKSVSHFVAYSNTRNIILYSLFNKFHVEACFANPSAVVSLMSAFMSEVLRFIFLPRLRAGRLGFDSRQGQ